MGISGACCNLSSTDLEFFNSFVNVRVAGLTLRKDDPSKVKRGGTPAHPNFSFKPETRSVAGLVGLEHLAHDGPPLEQRNGFFELDVFIQVFL